MNLFYFIIIYTFSLFLTANFEEQCLEKYQHQIETLNSDELNNFFNNKNNSLLLIAGKYSEIISNLSAARMEYLLSNTTQINLNFSNAYNNQAFSAPSPFNKKNNNLNLSKLSVDADNYNKILLHVLGDDFGLNSGLEGANANLTLAHRIRKLEFIKSAMAQRVFIKDSDQATPCHSLANISDDIKNLYEKTPSPDLSQDFLTKAIEQSKLALELYNLSKNNQKQFREKLIVELNNLKIGESIFFPSGWTGHAIVFELEKENKENINFKMYNSGEGIGEYHASLIVGFEKKVFPYVELSGVKIKDFTSLVVTQALKDLHSPPENKTSKPTTFYKIFFPMLKGVKVEPDINKDEFKDPQTSGTCSYASLPWVMSSCLTNADNKNNRQEINKKSAYLEYLIKLLTLREYNTVFNTYKNLQTSDESINLFKKSINYFSSKTIDAFNDSVLNNKELTNIIIDLKNIKNKLEQIDKLVTSSPDFNKAPATSQKDVKFPQLSDLPVAQELVNAKASEKLEFTKPLTRCVARLKELSNISRDLSLDIKDFNNQDKLKIIDEVSKYAEEYLYNFLQAINNKELPKKALSMEQLLVSIKFLAVADMLSENVIPSTYSKTWGKILYNDLSVVTIKDPIWQEQYSLLKTYYENKKDSNDIDFFGFDLIPSGAMYKRRIFHDKNAIKKISLNKDYEKKFEDDKIFKDYEWAKKITENIEVITNQNIENKDLKLKQTVFNNIKKIALVADYLLTGDLSDDTKIPSNKIEFNYTTSKIGEFNYSLCQLSLFGSTSTRLSSKYDKSSLKEGLLDTKEVFSSIRPNFHLSNNFSDKNNELAKLFSNKSSKDIEKISSVRKRLTPNKVSQSNVQEQRTPTLSQELMRSILNLSSKRELQIERTLGFFTQRPYLLGFNNDLYREMFEKLMFEEDLLNTELAINTKLANKLSNFCKNLYTAFKKNEDIKGISFILKINNLFYLYAKKNNISSINFMNSSKEFIKIINNLNQKQLDDKLFLYGSLLLSYKYQYVFDKKDVEKLLLASFYYSNFKINKIELVFSDSDDLNIKNIIFEKLNKNIYLIDNNVLSALATNIFGENNYDFKKYLNNENIYEDRNHKIILNINNLSLYKDNKKISSFPINLPKFREVFGKDATLPSNALEISQDIYEWRNGNETFRVKIGKYGEAEYLRDFGEKYSKYYLLKDREVANLVNSTFMLDLLKNNWLEVSYNNSSTKIITTDIKTGKQITTGYLANDNSPHINRVSDDARLFSFTSIDEHFKAIEDERHIYAWNKFSDGIAKIS